MYRNYVNEDYYAQDDTPSFYQFKGKYHFYDDEGRQYKIATKNRQGLQNARFKNSRARSVVSKPEEALVDNYGLVKLFVKLTDPLTPWFVRRDINKSLTLHTKDGTQTLVVELKKEEKVQVKRRVGTIFVKGLDKYTLHDLLNP